MSKQANVEWVEQQFQTIIEKGNMEIENLIWQNKTFGGNKK